LFGENKLEFQFESKMGNWWAVPFSVLLCRTGRKNYHGYPNGNGLGSVEKWKMFEKLPLDCNNICLTFSFSFFSSACLTAFCLNAFLQLVQILIYSFL